MAEDTGPVVWLARHAESGWNEAGLVQGHADAPGLTAEGREQAGALAGLLTGTGVELVVCSDLLRAVQTAEIVATGLGVPLVLDARLRERNLGVLEGGTAAALVPALTGYDQGRCTDPDAKPEGGESVRELYERATGCLDGFAAMPPASTFAVVTHGGFLRVVKAWFDQVPFEAMRWPRTPNAVLWRAELGSRTLDLDPAFPVIGGED
ncbi:MAG: histidine phosphatase family protein [Acidimicrobiales bacterium]